jgi:signal transduction histidine kinase
MNELHKTTGMHVPIAVEYRNGAMDKELLFPGQVAISYFHPLLKEQFNEQGMSLDHIPLHLQEFIESVNRSYWQAETERLLMERAHKLNELRLEAVGEDLLRTHDALERRVHERTRELLASNSALEREVLERRQAEHALLENREEYRRIAEKLRRLTMELTRAEEAERRRLSSALHDSVVQTLVFAKLRIEALQGLSAPDPTGRELATIQDALMQGIRELRTLQFELSPPVLYEFGLGPALETLALHVSPRSDVSIQVIDFTHSPGISTDLSVFLYQAARELLINALKHSGATNIIIALDVLDDSIAVTVHDNGKGLSGGGDPGTLTLQQGFGLFSIRERLRHLKGTLEVTSNHDAGITCRIVVPQACEAV